MKLGFIGLGRLGAAVAGRLRERGHDLVVWNRTPGRAPDLDAAVVDSPRAVAAAADTILLCLFDSAAVHAVLEGDDGLLAGGLDGRIVVDLTTNHFREAPRFHDLCREAGGTYLEAPVLGSVVPASQGRLTVLVSGDADAYARCEPLLGDIGAHLFHLPEPGLATRMKLINNLTLGSFMATLAEAVAFGEDVGVPRADVLEILSVGGGKSLVLDAKHKKLLDDDWSTHFSCDLIRKDLQFLQELAYERRRPLFTGATAKELYAEAARRGLGDLDFAAIAELFR